MRRKPGLESPPPEVADRAWYERWFAPGLIAAAVGVLVLLLEISFASLEISLPVVGFVSILLSLILFGLGWALDRHQERIEERFHREISNLERALRSDLARIAADVKEPYLLYLRNRLLHRARRPLWELEDRSKALVTVEDCTSRLIRAIELLDDRGTEEILAICGQKAWDSPDVRTYYEANYERAQRGVKVKRIFVQEPGKVFSEGEKTVLREHLGPNRPNVEGRVIFGADFRHLTDLRLPPGFGFAILGRSVIVHWGMGANLPEAGRELSDPWFVEEHQRIFSRLWDRVAVGGDEAGKARIFREILGEDPPAG